MQPSITRPSPSGPFWCWQTFEDGGDPLAAVLRAVTEHGHPLAAEHEDAGAAERDVRGRADEGGDILLAGLPGDASPGAGLGSGACGRARSAVFGAAVDRRGRRRGALPPAGDEVQRSDAREAESEQSAEHRRPLGGLQAAERDVQEDQAVSHVDQHVERLPDRRRQVREPEVVRRRRHQEQDDQRQQSERLERELGEAVVVPVARQHAHQRVEHAQAVELDDREAAVRGREQEHADAEVAAVVEQGQEPPVEPAERSDGEHDMEQQQGAGAQAADQQRLDRRLGAGRDPDADEEAEEQHHACRDRQVVQLLAAVPEHRPVAGAHGCSSGSFRFGAPFRGRRRSGEPRTSRGLRAEQSLRRRASRPGR